MIGSSVNMHTQCSKTRYGAVQCCAVQDECIKEGRASVVGYLPISLVSLLYMVVWFASPI